MNEATATSGFLPWIALGDDRIQSYFLVISIVFSACAAWIPKRAVKLGRTPTRAIDLFIAAMAGGFLGSRLLHVFFEEPKYYIEDPVRVFEIMAGGFVWYGGAIGAALAMIVFLKIRKDRDLLGWFDFFAPIAAFGYAGGRIACVLTGCCYGRVCHWGETLFRFPTQGFAAVWELAVGWLLLRLENQDANLNRPHGTLFATWLILHSAGRMIMEALRDDPRGPAFGFITISMALSATFLVFAALILFKYARSTQMKV